MMSHMNLQTEKENTSLVYRILQSFFFFRVKLQKFEFFAGLLFVLFVKTFIVKVPSVKFLYFKQWKYWYYK